MRARKVIEGEQFVLGLLEQPGDLWRRRLESVDDVGQAFAGFSPVSALKIWRIAVAIIGCWERPQWPSMSRRKCTVRRCHRHPSTLAIAVLRHWWASETHTLTPARCSS